MNRHWSVEVTEILISEHFWLARWLSKGILNWLLLNWILRALAAWFYRHIIEWVIKSACSLFSSSNHQTISSFRIQMIIDITDISNQSRDEFSRPDNRRQLSLESRERFIFFDSSSQNSFDRNVYVISMIKQYENCSLMNKSMWEQFRENFAE